MNELNPEIMTIIFGAVSGTIGLITIFWKKFLKPIVKLCKNQDFFMESVAEIKKELTTNGGSRSKMLEFLKKYNLPKEHRSMVGLDMPF